MDDLISRQVVINALDAVCDRVCQYTKKQRARLCGAFVDKVEERISDYRGNNNG